MSDIHANPQQTGLGFWQRLVLAAAQAGESCEERLEKRVSGLEAELARLSTVRERPAKA